MKDYLILAINPGSTSTKIALYRNDSEIFTEKVVHHSSYLEKFSTVNDQLEYRRDTILKAIEKRGYRIQDIYAFVGRGGGLEPCEGGTFEVNELMLDHAKNGTRGRHPAVLGTQLAAEFAKLSGGKAYMVDSPEADEMDEVARITGIKNIYRQSRFHTLNHKRTAIIAAREMGSEYSKMNFVVAHLGGGVSVVAHRKGKCIDSTDHLGGDSPLAPTRTGIVPGIGLIEMCFSGKYTKGQMIEKINKTGGLVDLMGTSEMSDIVYQIAKHIGAMAAALDGDVDAVLLTGGIAHDRNITEMIRKKTEFIAPVRVYPGEFEMEAMIEGAYRVLSGEEKAKTYTGIPPYTKSVFED